MASLLMVAALPSQYTCRHAIEYGGRPNLIKDSTLQADVVRRAIPDFEARREHLRSFDIEGRVQSELTRRIGL